jgi:hypothetical protein
MAAPVTQWKQFKIQIPGADLFEQVRALLETLLIYLEILKALLETIKTFLIDFGNPIRALVEALIRLILTLLEALKRTGLYAYFDIPDFATDPNMRGLVGGWPGFKSRWKGSFYDAKDANRPQPLKNALKGGFILIVAEADMAWDFLRLIKALLKFFSKDFAKPYYPAPANVRAIPVGDKGDPILSVTKIFKENVQAIAVEWSLPTTTGSPDPNYEGLIMQFSTEFYPPGFLIERSSIPLNKEVTSDQLAVAGTAGYATKEVATEIEINGQPGVVKTRKIRLMDEHGEQFIKFEQYAVISPSSNLATCLLGQLGTFRWIDTSVEYDKTYYYRVRAFSGSLRVKPDGTIPFFTLPRDFGKPNPDGTNVMVVWPADDISDEPVMGRGSPIVKCRIHQMPPDFDVIEAIRKVFLVALSFGFDKQPPDDATFDQNGNPVPPTTVEAIGMGLLAGKTSIFAAPFDQLIAELKSGYYATDEVTGQYPIQPWQNGNIRAQAARLTIKIASAMLEQGTDVAKQFQTIMQGLWPAGKPGVSIPVSSEHFAVDVVNLEQMVTALTEIRYEADDQPVDAEAPTSAEIKRGYVPKSVAMTWVNATGDVNTRKNVVVAVNYLLSLAYTGVPPNWEQVSLLRDIIPWSAGFLFDLLDKIQALLDAFKGILDEIRLFIELLIRKIDVLERLIKFLIQLLDYLTALTAVSFNMLSVKGLTGNVEEWFAAVDNAGGSPPKSGPRGYAGGVCLAYLAVDVTAFEKAFKMIF